MSGQLKHPEYYFHRVHKSLYTIWWKQNRPEGKEWIKITKERYEELLKELSK
jgi:hypothetical protein